MKKFTIGITLFISTLLLVTGCGNFGKNADKPGTEDALFTNERDKEGGTLETSAGYGFSQFDLEIDVDGKDAIDAEYDVTEKQTASEYEDKLRQVKLKDVEAMDELNKMFMQIRLTKDTPEQEAIDNILKWFDIENYSKFDLDVDFDNGTKLTIEDVK